jgi:hypothetical protein
MVDEASTEKKSALGAILGWGLLALGTIGFIWFIATQLAVGWEDREDEALKMVKELQLPGMKHDLSDSTIEIGNAARASGQFVGQFSWSSSQVEGPMYSVKLTWMEGSQHKRAEWNVDLENQKIAPAGPTATEFLKRAGATEGAG